METMIQLDRVTKRFDGRTRTTALSEVSLTIARGELVSDPASAVGDAGGSRTNSA